MKMRLLLLVVVPAFCCAVPAFGVTHYVDLNSTKPTPPFTNWATAATSIQDAVGAAAAGDVVVVTNGVYPGGLAVNTPLTLLSVNGPQVSVINGGGTNHCATLADGASLTGFTLTNGVSQDVGSPYTGGGVSCASTNAFLTNCVLAGNSGSTGGGVKGGTLYNCTLTGNSAGAGGGAYGSTLYNCTLTGNSASSGGGGAAAGTLYNCTLTGNSVYRNDGGAIVCKLYNCIAYFNTAPMDANYDANSTLNYCCTTPLPANGAGNIAFNPQLAGASRLSADSPCISAGSAAYATGTDIDGEPWGNPPSIGCDEYHARAVTGPLTVSLLASYTNIAVGYGLSLMALIEGRPTESVWDFGDGDVAINQPYVTHSWTQAGHYLVSLWAFNESHEDGVGVSLTIEVVAQPVCYVAATGRDPQPPYASWATAATNIQDALDAMTVAGGLVLVTNGTYGGVVLGTPLTLLSVNGPQVTVINGRGTNQCAKLTAAASLSGFTLTNGWAQNGGGVWCSSAEAFLTNCVIVGNSASSMAGGAYRSTLYNCTLSSNFARLSGGGAGSSTLYNCTLTSNSAATGFGSGEGGGAYSCTLYNCTLSANSANGDAATGGGVSECKLYNCRLTGNSASAYGGGAFGSTLYNCTVSGNSAVNGGGGVASCTLYNCIAYFNTAVLDGANYESFGYSHLNYCCTTPLPSNGVGNIALDPELASASHLSADSPCIGAGSAAYATGTDIDGEPWANPPSIGCDEYHAGAVTGPLAVGLSANYTNVVVGYAVNFTALIEGRTTESLWTFGDGDVVMNRPYVTHIWTEPGDYLVAVWAFNESNWGGVSASLRVHVVAQPVTYVAAASSNPQSPYTTWATAATNIQDAVDAPLLGASVVVVSNGVYAVGGREAFNSIGNSVGLSRVAITNALSVRSVNGPRFTVIDGGGTNRCAFLTNGASLSGFTLTNGYCAGPYGGGGGVYCTGKAFLTNCVIVHNSAVSNSSGIVASGGGAKGGTLYNCMLSGNLAAGYGGGAYNCTLYNCALTGNSAHYDGGGAYNGTLYNCTLSGNSAARYGGGASAGNLYNCIAYFNTAPSGANWDSYNYIFFSNCCTSPLPTSGGGNITNSPMFVDYVGGNLRLQSNSPCINAGHNAYVATTTDLDGNPRIVSGTVDMGAYEYQGTGSVISYSWLQQYGLTTDGSADYADPDHDGMNNWQEWIAGTNPTNGLSVLKMLSPSITATSSIVGWQSVATRTYFLQRATNLVGRPSFSALRSNLAGQGGHNFLYRHLRHERRALLLPRRRAVNHASQAIVMNLYSHKPSATGLTKACAPRETNAAFGLADLLALLGLFVLLALLLTPALARTRVSDQGFQCLHNLRQLMAAMLMYTHDYHDLFPPNPDDGSTTPGYDWCPGQAGVGGSEEFNSDILMDPTRSLLVPYTGKNASLFHCPADNRTGRSTAPSTRGQVVASARTCSMNLAVGTDPYPPSKGQLPVNGAWLDGAHSNTRNGPWVTYAKTTSILTPTPARLFVLLDENPNSLNDACFSVVMVGNGLISCPGSWHNLGCSLAFADGPL